LSNTIGSALGGMNVAARRLAVASNNVVNLRSAPPSGPADKTGFHPLDLQQISNPDSGPTAKVRPSNVEPLKTYQPTNPQADPNGMVFQTNAPLERDAGELIAARRAFEANLAAVSTADKMIGSLFDEDV
jgi:flagellar basal-body rod protein FlgC